MTRILGGLVLILALAVPCPSKSQTLMPWHAAPPIDKESDLFEKLNKRLGTGNSLTTPSQSAEPTAGPQSFKLLSVPLSGKAQPKSPTLEVLRGLGN